MKTIENCIYEVSDLSNDNRVSIIEALEKSKPSFYWDYDDRLSNEQINNIVTHKENLFEDIYDNNIDYEYQLICDIIKKTINEITEIDDFVNDKNVRDFYDEFCDYVCVDYNIEQLCKNTGSINVRIHLKSNYDCINSHWFENQYEYNESYFGAMVDALNLNPKIVKQHLLDNGIDCIGSFPNKKNRNGKEYVSYIDFINELTNSISPVNELIFVTKINLMDYINNIDGVIETITIPSGNNCGIFSSSCGGGSIINMKLIKPITINLIKTGKTMYDRFKLETDTKDFGYTIDNTYGVTNSFWGKQSQLTFTKKDK